MKTYSLSELNRKSGELADEALLEPVLLMKRSRPHLVMLSVRDYERLAGMKVVDRLDRSEIRPRKKLDFAALNRKPE